jgi:hypothetical protein
MPISVFGIIELSSSTLMNVLSISFPSIINDLVGGRFFSKISKLLNSEFLNFS